MKLEPFFYSEERYRAVIELSGIQDSKKLKRKFQLVLEDEELLGALLVHFVMSETARDYPEPNQ